MKRIKSGLHVAQGRRLWRRWMAWRADRHLLAGRVEQSGAIDDALRAAQFRTEAWNRD